MSWKNNYWGVKKLKFVDTDRDGVPDIYDCDKNNPNRQGVLHDIYDTLRNRKDNKQYAKEHAESYVKENVGGVLTPKEKEEYTKAVEKTYYAERKLSDKLEREGKLYESIIVERMPSQGERKAYKPKYVKREDEEKIQYMNDFEYL